MKLNQLGLSCWTFTRTLQQTNIAMENPRKNWRFSIAILVYRSAKNKSKTKATPLCPTHERTSTSALALTSWMKPAQNWLRHPGRCWCHGMMWYTQWCRGHYITNQPEQCIIVVKGNLRKLPKFQYICIVWFPHLTNLTNMSIHLVDGNGCSPPPPVHLHQLGTAGSGQAAPCIRLVCS